MSMYLPNPDVGPTGAEPVEFLEVDDRVTPVAPDRSAPFAATDDVEHPGPAAPRAARDESGSPAS
jgi:hypothetical protein